MRIEIERKFDHFFKATMLWGHGWKRRRWMSQRVPVIQWQDPLTGLWYGKKTALKLLRVQLLDEFRC